MLCGIQLNGTLPAILIYLLALQSASSGTVVSPADHQRESATSALPGPNATLSDREKADLLALFYVFYRLLKYAFRREQAQIRC